MNCTSASYFLISYGTRKFVKTLDWKYRYLPLREDTCFHIKMSRRAKIGLYASMCTFLISRTRQIQHFRYYSIPFYDQYAVLKHSTLPRSCCFQVKNTGSKLEENIGISQVMELSKVNWAIIMCAFLIFAHTFGHGTQIRRNLPRIFLVAY